MVGVNLFGHQISHPKKLLSFEKFFMSDFLQINIFKIKVFIFVQCVRFVKSMRNLFIIYFLNALMLCLFGADCSCF